MPSPDSNLRTEMVKHAVEAFAFGTQVQLHAFHCLRAFIAALSVLGAHRVRNGQIVDGHILWVGARQHAMVIHAPEQLDAHDGVQRHEEHEKYCDILDLGA